MATTKFFNVLEMRPHFTAGTWTYSTSSNIMQAAKTAADEAPVVVVSIPRHLYASGQGEATLKSVSCQYAVGTAALDAAPSVVFNKLTMSDSTRAVARAAAADTTTVSGSDTTGTATGTYAVKGAFDVPQTLDDNQCLTAEFTFDCAATTVLTIRGFIIETA